MNKFGLEEIRAIRSRWAEMPVDQAEAEQKKLLAGAKRRIARIKKQKAKAAVKTAASRRKATKRLAHA